MARGSPKGATSQGSRIPPIREVLDPLRPLDGMTGPDVSGVHADLLSCLGKKGAHGILDILDHCIRPNID